MLDGQTVHGAAGSRRQDDGLAGERVVMNQVEQMFERAGIGGAVHWRADHEDVGRLDGVNDRLGLRACPGAGQGWQHQRGGISHLDDAGGEVEAPGYGVDDRSHQHGSA